MSPRKIIRIDEKKCNGCGDCIPNCPEGALQIIDGKARLVSDLFCDGLGACIGHCPQGAITTEDREAAAYDERKVMENIVKQGENVIKAHLQHLKEQREEGLLQEAFDFLKERNIPVFFAQENSHAHHGHTGCPGAQAMDFRGEQKVSNSVSAKKALPSQLCQWPVQLRLVPAVAAYLENADILIAADCVPFAYADFHEDLLRDKIVLVGCPKFDDLHMYKEKLRDIFRHNTIKSITYAHMEVPCCFGLVSIIQEAIAESGKSIRFSEATISVRGERMA